MKRLGWVAAAALMALAVIAVPAGAQKVTTSSDGDFLVEWGSTGGGQPMIEGYVTNASGWWAKRVQLEVESLDASGRVLGRTTVAVPADVPPGGRVYFNAKPGTAGSDYRITVQSFERLLPSQT